VKTGTLREWRFYVYQDYRCPECEAILEWRARPDLVDSKMLIHPVNACRRSDRYFYPPVMTLPEIDKTLLESPQP